MTTRVAFEILYREYYVRVFGLCRRLLNSASLAEDATQETFMRAFRHFASYRSTDPFWQWIATIANNHCIDLLRRRHTQGNLFGDETTEFQQITAADSGALTLLVDDENQRALATAIGKLPDRYRVPLVLAYWNEASYEEIAGMLSISTSHVGVLLLRARQQLRTSLTQAGLEVTDP